MTPKEMALCAAKALDEKKGKEISAIEITDLTALADYFVFCTGSSNTQINALCGAVEKNLEEEGGVKVLTGRATGTAPGCCWTTAISWSTSSPRRPGSSTPWSGSGRTASPWTSAPS